jgi:putative hemolysin
MILFALLFCFGITFLTAGTVFFAYFDRVYREVGRVTSSRIHDHLQNFERAVEPRLRVGRRRAALSFSLLARFWLAFDVAATVMAVLVWQPASQASAAVEIILFVAAEIIVAMHIIPLIIILRTEGTWASSCSYLLRVVLALVSPVAGLIELVNALLHLSESDEAQRSSEPQDTIESLVDAATAEGIIEHDEARLIEHVVEFSDISVRSVMTPTSDVVAIRASATLAELRAKFVETKFSRLPVHESSLDEVIGIALARDILQVNEGEASCRTAREIVRPALFVPESKLGSDLLNEMQRKNQQMAIVVDEFGSTAGIVTMEDLVEEIVGEIGQEDRPHAPEILREPSGAVVVRGNVPIGRLEDLFGLKWDESGVSTVAGLLNRAAGHVPKAGEIVNYDGLRFEILEASDRKVLRLRVRRLAEFSAAAVR